MARPLRIDVDGGWYHVMSRGFEEWRDVTPITHRPSIQLHALGASVAVVIFWASLFVIGETPCSEADFLASVPFMLASVVAALVGTAVARASLKRYTGELHNTKMDTSSNRRYALV